MFAKINGFFRTFYGAFLGNDGIVSTTKLLSFTGFICFLLVSFFILWKAPDKFNYELFAILAGGGGASLRVFDKWLNVKGAENEWKNKNQESCSG